MDSSADAYIRQALVGVPGDPRIFTQYTNSMGLDPLQAIAWAKALNSRCSMTLIEGGPGTGKTRLSIVLAICLALRGHRVLFVDISPGSCHQTKEEVSAHRDMLLKMDTTFDNRVKIFSLPNYHQSHHETGDETEENILSNAYDMVEANKNQMDIDSWSHIVKLYRKKSCDKTLSPGARKAAQQWLAILRVVEADRSRTTNRKPDAHLCRQFLDGAGDAIKEVIADPSLNLIIADKFGYSTLCDSSYKPEILVLDNATVASEQQLEGLLHLRFQRTILVGDRVGLRPLMIAKDSTKMPMPRRPRDIQTTATHFARLAQSSGVPYYQLKVNYRGHHDIMFLPGLLGYGWSSSATKYTAVERNPYKVVMDFWQSDSGFQYRENRRDPGFFPRFLHSQSSNRIRRLLFNIKGGRSGGLRTMVNYANANHIADIVSKILCHQPKNTKKLQPLKADQITIVTSTNDQRARIEDSMKLQQTRRQAYQLDDLPIVRTTEEWGGCSNNIIILDITPANQYEGASLYQFMDWHKMNIALTSCKDLIWIVGNLDLWRSELNILMMKPQTRNFAFFIVDLLDLGDIIDVQGINAIPTWQELHSDPSRWTCQLRLARAPKEKYWAKEAKKYKADKKAQEKMENEMIKKLRGARAHAAELQAIFERGDGPGLNFFQVARPTVEERKIMEESVLRLRKE